VREFVQELPNNSAAGAWQRSIALVRELPLDPSQEPRLKKLDDTTEATKATHPFFWAGYLLVDTGTRSAQETEATANPPAAASENRASTPQKPAAADKPVESSKTPPSVVPPIPPQSRGSSFKTGSG
jgi:hypothetical protein